jgi:hypothetical protein
MRRAGVINALAALGIAAASGGSSARIVASWKLTPGAFNRAVTQRTIGSTICVHGWTKTIRPSVSYTNRLKLVQMRQYHETGRPSRYEEDHLIPLELGGHPTSPKNLWPEPHPRADAVDQIETSLKRQVCRGTLMLAQARRRISLLKHTRG